MTAHRCDVFGPVVYLNIGMVSLNLFYGSPKITRRPASVPKRGGKNRYKDALRQRIFYVATQNNRVVLETALAHQGLNGKCHASCAMGRKGFASRKQKENVWFVHSFSDREEKENAHPTASQKGMAAHAW